MTGARSHGRDQHGRDQRGAVTAEAAVVLPVLVAVTLGLIWLLGIALAQVRVTDAAHQAARALARGDSEQVAVDLGTRLAGPGSRVSVTVGAEQVTATAAVDVDGPGGIFGWFGSVRVDATAVARPEDAR